MKQSSSWRKVFVYRRTKAHLAAVLEDKGWKNFCFKCVCGSISHTPKVPNLVCVKLSLGSEDGWRCGDRCWNER